MGDCRKEGGEVCSKDEAEWVDLNALHIRALILLHPRQVPKPSNDLETQYSAGDHKEYGLVIWRFMMEGKTT